MKKFYVLVVLVAGALLFCGFDAQRGRPQDGSGTITTGGTSQVIFGENDVRVYFEFQNVSDTTMYINFEVAADNGTHSFQILSGGTYVNPPQFCPVGPISVYCASTGKQFIAKQQ